MAPAVVKFTPPVLDTRPISGEDLAAWNLSPEQLMFYLHRDGSQDLLYR